MLPIIGLIAGEAIAYERRRRKRREVFQAAADRAIALGRKLIVIGDPTGGVTHGDYGCGDLTLDLTGCPDCPNGKIHDLGQDVIPADNDSAVVYDSCTLSYVENFEYAWSEIKRVAGSPENIFLVEVEPTALTAWFYPNPRRVFWSTDPRNLHWHEMPLREVLER